MMEISTSSYQNFDLIETVNEKEEEDDDVHTTKLIIDSEIEDNMETDQKTDKVLIFIQICMGLIVILSIIFGGFVLWHKIKSHPNDPNVNEFTTTVAATDLQACTCTKVGTLYVIFFLRLSRIMSNHRNSKEDTFWAHIEPLITPPESLTL